MLGKLRGFTNSKLAGVLVAIIIVPFVFWGMGSVFSGGNTNNIAKINNFSISTKDFIEHINRSRINPEYIKKNLDNNCIIRGTKGFLKINQPWKPESSSMIEVSNNKHFYIKSVNSKLCI